MCIRCGADAVDARLRQARCGLCPCLPIGSDVSQIDAFTLTRYAGFGLTRPACLSCTDGPKRRRALEPNDSVRQRIDSTAEIVMLLEGGDAGARDRGAFAVSEGARDKAPI